MRMLLWMMIALLSTSSLHAWAMEMQSRDQLTVQQVPTLLPETLPCPEDALECPLDGVFWEERENDFAFGETKAVKPYGVRLLQRSNFKKCYHYKVDWGDGSPPETQEIEDETGCAASEWTLSLIQAYQKPGIYEIHWYYGEKEIPEHYKLLKIEMK